MESIGNNGTQIYQIGGKEIRNIPLLWSILTFIISALFCRFVRWMFGSLGHNLERFGMVHIATILFSIAVPAVGEKLIQ